MPCQSYDTSWANSSSDRDVQRLKKEVDKLARIACEALTELEKTGKADFLILKNDELREWWEKHKEADRKEQARIVEQERREKIKQSALNRLTAEEKEVLGLNKSSRKRASDPFEESVYNLDDFLKTIKTINGGT